MSRYFTWGSVLALIAILGLTAIIIGQQTSGPAISAPTVDQWDVEDSLVVDPIISTLTPAGILDANAAQDTKPAIVIIPPSTTAENNLLADSAVNEPEAVEDLELRDSVEPFGHEAKIEASAGKMSDGRPRLRSIAALPIHQSAPAQFQRTEVPTATQVIQPSISVTATTPMPTNHLSQEPTATPDVGLTAAAIAPFVASMAPIHDRSAIRNTPSAFIVPLPAAVQDDSALGAATAVLMVPDRPYALATTPLYVGPSVTSATVDTLAAGSSLEIVALHSTGTWYLLVNGSWIPVDAVGNAPQQLPLVVATITPSPTSSPTLTPSGTPIPKPTSLPTLTPTPTSLEAPICACQSDQFECLGSYFSSQEDAQLCFEYCFRQTGMDIHNLDPNLNGRACENLN